MGVGDLLQFENLGTAETGDDQGFHGESLTVGWRDGPRCKRQSGARFAHAACAHLPCVAGTGVRGPSFSIYNGSGFPIPGGLRDSLAAGDEDCAL
jgi:hypothetical protein